MHATLDASGKRSVSEIIAPTGRSERGLIEAETVFARGPVAVQPAEVKRLVTDALVIHQVHERVLVPGPEGDQIAWVLATNAYLKTEQGWRMVLHHASPGQAIESPDLHTGSGSVLH